MRGVPRSGRPLWALAAPLAVLLGVYSQTWAFAWDEGFHLLTAQSITKGRRPYLDFCFSQTPLNAYWNAGWFEIFGDTWRTAHAVAALMTVLAVLLTADYVLRRFPDPRWRAPLCVAAACLAGMNIVVVEFGTIAQAYALCLFLSVSAFRMTLAAVDRAGFVLPAAVGLAASAAANASLLTAPVAPVLLLWILFRNRAGSRWTKLAAFAAGGAAACAPLAWLFAHGPRQTLFNVFEYNLLYRRLHWSGAFAHNIGEWSAWLGSPQALLLGGLALAGLVFLRKQPELQLCGWLAAALLVHISTATPTFTRYYLLAVPFLAILACAGLYWAGSRLAAPDRPFRPVLAVCLITGLCLARTLYNSRSDLTWHDVERAAAKVKEVTPPQAALLADEPIYFLTHHRVPPGMELADSHKLNFPSDVAARLHVVTEAELERQIRARTYDTIEMTAEDERIEKLGLPQLYAHSEDLDEMRLFWGLKPLPPTAR